MKIDDWLLEILACPQCRAPLRADAEASELVCTNAECALAYPVRDDIPVLLVDEARRPQGGLAPPADPPAGTGTATKTAPADDARVLLDALGVNLAIAATKFLAFAFTGSASMLAESVHSLADSGNQLLLLVGRRRSRRVETAEHPFGFSLERYLYGFIVAIMIFTVGALFSGYQGVQRIIRPGPVDSPAIAFAVLGVAIIGKAYSLRTAAAESKMVRGQYRLSYFIWRTKTPDLPAVLLEDLAALVGLVFALGGVALSAITHRSQWDGAGSLAIGFLLGVVAVILAIEMKSRLIGESASAAVELAIVAAMEDGPELQRVIHLRTVHLGPEVLLVAAKVAILGEQTGFSIASGIDAAERRIRAAVPIAKLIYLEPDLYRASGADEDDPAVAVLRDPDE